MADTISPELPHDILFHNILPRLPAKYLLQCMCVTKQCHSFLKTPFFTTTHLHHITTDDHHKLLVFSATKPFVFHTLDCESPEDGLSVGRPLPFKATPMNMWILTSFRGLVCVAVTNYNHRGQLEGWLYYNEDDYKLLRVTHNDDHAYIYSLKSDKWRKINFTVDFKPIWSSLAHKYQNLYFFNQDYGPICSIIRFDIKTEKFTEIAIQSIGYGNGVTLNFTVIRGCIHLFMIYYNNYLDRWQLEGWRMDGDWMKVVDYRIEEVKDLEVRLNNIVHLMRNGSWLTHARCGRYVSKLDFIRKKSWSHEISWLYDVGSMYIPPQGKYIETLVSPNRYLLIILAFVALSSCFL